VAHDADFSFVALAQKQLANVIGNSGTRLPADAETGQPLNVWSCRTPLGPSSLKPHHSASPFYFAGRAGVAFPVGSPFLAMDGFDRYRCPKATEREPVGTYVPPPPPPVVRGWGE